ncbi:hypothetical protein RclHR1_10800001 [Rhizophagus clarus]|uniref:Uncharacterized protein n=1 Tax=Rhizophagus clarus TaxID=94130 RepID=A0A2Z6QHA0_9GLOM|nr:hypothetical protein RclHR1_10800001 [Rhizophagus clarus]GES80480.1 hypothetical protein RCL_jg10805.t1 [Rhizophagus clarus]
MRRAAQVSQYVYQYNKSFMKVIKHLPLVRLRNDSSATPFIPTKDKVAARHRQFNLPKLVISNRTDLSGFNPEELLREERKDKLAEILDFIPQHRLFNKKRTVEYSPGSPRWWRFVNDAMDTHRKQSRAQRNAINRHKDKLNFFSTKGVSNMDEYHDNQARIKDIVQISSRLDQQLRAITSNFKITFYVRLILTLLP